MIVVWLNGGLGNQLFQYAAGRALALANGCGTKLDVSAFDTYSLHNGYELNLFNIDAQIASTEEVSHLTGARSKFAKFARRKLGFHKRTHILERAFCFDACFFDLKPPLYLEGYWQSYKYFKAFEAQIRSELTVRTAPAGKNLDILERVSAQNSVSVHVRCGDYLSNPVTRRIHGFPGIGYYEKAIQHIAREVQSPQFFIFSDDLAWVKNNLALPIAATFVSHNTGESSYEDMRLMSLCKHNVIANSTFSWWAAWLNRNPGKIVVFPKRWFTDPGIDTRDLTPDTWIGMDG